MPRLNAEQVANLLRRDLFDLNLTEAIEECVGEISVPVAGQKYPHILASSSQCGSCVVSNPSRLQEVEKEAVHFRISLIPLVKDKDDGLPLD